jgi:hypothetical protein
MAQEKLEIRLRRSEGDEVTVDVESNPASQITSVAMCDIALGPEEIEGLLRRTKANEKATGEAYRGKTWTRVEVEEDGP